MTDQPHTPLNPAPTPTHSADSERWLEWVKQVYAIARWGLTYAKDPFDLERYEVLEKLSAEMMADFAQLDIQRIQNLFANEIGYLTPKVDVRGVVFQNDRILLVQEKWDGRWTVPGGWADVGLSPAEVAVKEVREESGLDVKPVKLLALLDKKFYPHPASPYHIYKVFIECEVIGGQLSKGLESLNADFFTLEDLPELSHQRITHEQLQTLFAHRRDPDRPTDWD